MTPELASATVCAIVLTLNEEAVLPKCLRSLDWVDDLVVLDSGSTDATERISSEHGARFLVRIPDGPFLISEQRNWALANSGTHASWLLFLDADEVVGPELVCELRRALSSPSTHDAYELTPRYWYLGAWMRRCMNYPNWHPRLVRTRGVARFSGGVWEHFAEGASVGRIETPYEHFGNAKGIGDWLKRHDRYSTWDA